MSANPSGGWSLWKHIFQILVTVIAESTHIIHVCVCVHARASARTHMHVYIITEAVGGDRRVNLLEFPEQNMARL